MPGRRRRHIRDPLFPPRGFQEATGKPRRYVKADEDSIDFVFLVAVSDWCISLWERVVGLFRAR